MKFKFVSVLLALCTVAGSMTMPAFTENVQAAQTENSAQTEENSSAKEDALEDYQYKILEDNTVEITNYKGTETALVIPETIEQKPVTALASGAFSELENVESITIPKGVTSLPDYVFAYCDSLEQVIFPEGLKAIGESVFTGCKSLKSLTLPDSLRDIDFSAFSGCTALSDITFPKTWNM